MKEINPRTLMIVGVSLMVAGVVFPLLMVLQILKSTYFLNFFSYTLQILGLILSMIGLVTIAGIRKRK